MMAEAWQLRLAAIMAFLFSVAFTPVNAGDLVPQPPKGRGEHCVAPTEFMRRNHMSMMKHQREETVHEGVRGKPFSLAGCMECHAVKGADSQPVIPGKRSGSGVAGSGGCRARFHTAFQGGHVGRADCLHPGG